VIGEASDGCIAVQQARALRPDVVLMDMRMPVMDGVAATAHICAEHPDIVVLGMSTFTTDDYVVDLLRAGASGYLVKDTSPAELVRALHAVSSGDHVLSPAVIGHVVHAVRPSAPPLEKTPGADLLRTLTSKELEVIRLLAQGMSNQEMAQALWVSESTIKARFVSIMRKLDARDRVQVLLKAIDSRLVEVRL